jgi:hypothetical protein
MFELMVPNDLKDGLGQLSNVVFVLDGDSTASGELTDSGPSPLCAAPAWCGSCKRYRQHLRVTTSRCALVVGDRR